jgi:hypothetical protein
VLLAAIGSAVVAPGFASAVRGEATRALRGSVVVLGGLAVLASLVIPFPRDGADGTTAAIHVKPTSGDRGLVYVTLNHAGAADDARWFQASTWQGGDLVLAKMVPVGTDKQHYVSDKPLPVFGPGKTLVRLHKGSRMMAVPVHFPADPEINKPEIAAVDRTAPFLREGRYLMRESHGGAAWFAIIIYVLLAGVACVWVAAFVIAASRVPREQAPAPVDRKYALVA